MKTANKHTLVISRDFSATPGSRYIIEGDFSGEALRKEILTNMLQSAIDDNTKLFIDLDGTSGYGTSFLEEAFGGLIRENNYNYQTICDHVILKSEEEEYLLDDIDGYLQDAQNEK
jgi:hypothetical protein